MASKSRRLKRLDTGAQSESLDVAIQDVKLARNICSISPAQVAFDAVSAFLAAIKVRPPLLCEGELPVHTYSGF
jgi:hypothetical protein